MDDNASSSTMTEPLEDAQTQTPQTKVTKLELEDVPLPAPTTVASHTRPRRLGSSSSRASSRSASSNCSRGRSRGTRSASHSLSRGASRAASVSRSISPTRWPASAQLEPEPAFGEPGPSRPRPSFLDTVMGANLSTEQRGVIAVEELPDLNLTFNPGNDDPYHREDNLYNLYNDPSLQLLPSGSLETVASSSSGPVLIEDQHTVPPNGRQSQARPAKRRRPDVDDESIIDISESTPLKRESPSLIFEPSSPEVQIISPKASSSNHKRLKPSSSTSSKAGPSTLAEDSSSKGTVGGPEPLSAYICPICFSPPTNATLTPCGHVCCGECLFTAVRASLQRTATMPRPEYAARCPVCRAELKGWNGRGGGVIGLMPRTMLSL